MDEQRVRAWLETWQRAALDRPLHQRKEMACLRILAAQATRDACLARRMAIVEVPSDGRPHPGPDLQAAVEERLGEDCHGTQAGQTLENDIATLQAWDIRIGHSDTPGVGGYYLKDPAIQVAGRPADEEPANIKSILRVSAPELDFAYLNHEAARLGAFGTWRELLDEIG